MLMCRGRSARGHRRGGSKNLAERKRRPFEADVFRRGERSFVRPRGSAGRGRVRDIGILAIPEQTAKTEVANCRSLPIDLRQVLGGTRVPARATIGRQAAGKVGITCREPVRRLQTRSIPVRRRIDRWFAVARAQLRRAEYDGDPRPLTTGWPRPNVRRRARCGGAGRRGGLGAMMPVI